MGRGLTRSVVTRIIASDREVFHVDGVSAPWECCIDISAKRRDEKVGKLTSGSRIHNVDKFWVVKVRQTLVLADKTAVFGVPCPHVEY